jgi:uncharacterized Ntn-hydrolase superfamily protein
MTFSIAARCQRTGMFGVAIASSSPAVAARCAHARTGAGAVATQNITDPALGPLTLNALAQGQSADTALRQSLAATPFGDYRQLVVVGAQGMPAIHSGSKALGIVGSALGLHSAAAGNLLADRDVPKAMVDAFEKAEGHFGARLLQALSAGMARGGEAGPVHSAGLLVVREVSWPIVDLRVDWAEAQPIEELRALWDIYQPQIEDYVRRGVDPSQAPTFGVPGDL